MNATAAAPPGPRHRWRRQSLSQPTAEVVPAISELRTRTHAGSDSFIRIPHTTRAARPPPPRRCRHLDHRVSLPPVVRPGSAPRATGSGAASRALHQVSHAPPARPHPRPGRRWRECHRATGGARPRASSALVPGKSTSSSGAPRHHEAEEPGRRRESPPATSFPVSRRGATSTDCRPPPCPPQRRRPDLWLRSIMPAGHRSPSSPRGPYRTASHTKAQRPPRRPWGTYWVPSPHDPEQEAPITHRCVADPAMTAA